jgi:hypothetical protein
VFPVSNELAVIGAFEAYDDEMDASEQLIAEINGAIILGAERQIYARDSDFAYRMAHNKKNMRGVDLLKDQCMNRGVD